jgi:UDP-N-acetylmuramate--alanine ligase
MPPIVETVVNELRTDSRSASRFAGKRVHFIGIGGCGMSGLARILLDAGALVTGSELTSNTQTFELASRGVQISRHQKGEQLSHDVDLVVRTAAVPDSNQEYLAARAFGIRTIKYAQLLGEIMAERAGVAVAGTHGKSTTTAMIAHALMQCGADPSFVVGGAVPQLGGGSRSGASELFIAEACEFDRSFHHLHPRIALITNIEEDHLDCYRNLDEIVESFQYFARLVPADGLIIAGGRDGNVIRALSGVKSPVELCAIGDGFAWSTRVVGINAGCYEGDVFYKGAKLCSVGLSIPGEHNLLNATMAVAACRACGVDPQRAASAIGSFTGVDRRMSEVGKLNGATIVDANLDDIKDPAKRSKHPGLWRTTGHIGFLGHGAEVEFRNLRVKEL